MTNEEAEALTRHSLDRQVTYSVAEHEVLLSFVNDYGAELFDSWWYLTGHRLFTQWVESREEDAG